MVPKSVLRTGSFRTEFMLMDLKVVVGREHQDNDVQNRVVHDRDGTRWLRSSTTRVFLGHLGRGRGVRLGSLCLFRSFYGWKKQKKRCIK